MKYATSEQRSDPVHEQSCHHVCEIIHKSCWTLANIFAVKRFGNENLDISLLSTFCELITTLKENFRAEKSKINECVTEATFVIGNLITEVDNENLYDILVSYTEGPGILRDIVKHCCSMLTKSNMVSLQLLPILMDTLGILLLLDSGSAMGGM